MHVVVVHNQYRSSAPSGENMAVADDIDGLRECGVKVTPWLTYSDSLVRQHGVRSATHLMAAAAGPVLGTSKQRSLVGYLAEARPDLVHLHNINPFYSPRLIVSIRKLGIPVVQTVHNYRRSCAKGSFFRDGSLCNDCERQSPARAVLHGCYQESRLRSVPMATSQVLHGRVWAQLDRNIVLTDFQRSWLRSHGIPDEAIAVRPTPIPDSAGGRVPSSDRRLCFVGRIDHEKGVDLLLDAWLHSRMGPRGWTLDVVGDGPLLDEARSRASDGVVLHGRLAPEATGKIMDRAQAVMIPSRWLEGFPRVAAEAFCRGKPVLALDNPNMRSVVQDCGWLASAESLHSIMQEVSDSNSLAVYGDRARRRFEADLERGGSMRHLVEIYRDVVLSRG